MRAQTELDVIRFLSDFRLADYHNSLDFMRTVKTLADSLCVIFVADFLRFILNHCKETRMEIFIMTSESCAMMYLQERNLANAFLISFDAEATPFFTGQHVELRPGLSEHKYL